MEELDKHYRVTVTTDNGNPPYTVAVETHRGRGHAQTLAMFSYPYKLRGCECFYSVEELPAAADYRASNYGND